MTYNKTIFFVNSDPKLTSIYEPVLSQYFSFDSAQDGLSALRSIRLRHPEVIISDYHLPLLSGLALLKHVRSNPQLARIPFLFLTNHDDPTEALNFGASDWIHRHSTPPASLVDKVYYHLKINQPQTY